MNPDICTTTKGHPCDSARHIYRCALWGLAWGYLWALVEFLGVSWGSPEGRADEAPNGEGTNDLSLNLFDLSGPSPLLFVLGLS